MDIKSLLNNQLIDRKRNERISDSKSELIVIAKKNSEPSTVQDQVSISTTQSSDLSFAQSVYKKLDESTMERIRLVRSKAENGEYTNEKAIQRLAASVEKDIYQLEADSFNIDFEPRYPVDISKLKEQIVQNADIYSEVADRLSKILSKI
jgi:hypothetical protein